MASTEREPLVIAEPQLGRRRRFSAAEKRSFIAEADQPGETMSSVGRRYGLSVSLLFRWRRQLHVSGGEAAGQERTPAPPEGKQDELARLRLQVRELQRQLDQKVEENVLLRERLGEDEPAAQVAAHAGSLARVARDGSA